MTHEWTGVMCWCNMTQYFEIFQRISFLVDNATFIADTSDRESEVASRSGFLSLNVWWIYFLKYIINVCVFLRNRNQFSVFLVIFVFSASKLIRNGYYCLRIITTVKICCPLLRVFIALEPNVTVFYTRFDTKNLRMIKTSSILSKIYLFTNWYTSELS